MLPKSKRTLTLSRSLQGLIENIFSDEQKVTVFQKLYIRIEQYLLVQLNGKEKAAQAFQQLVDSEIDVQKNINPKLASQITCKKGCTYCCEQLVCASRDEAELIMNYLEEHPVEISMARLKDQYQWEKENWVTKPRGERRCAFLGEDGGCQIYPVRPMSCRKALSLDDPEKCNKENPEIPRMYLVPEAEVSASAAFNTSETDSLPRILVKVASDREDQELNLDYPCE